MNFHEITSNPILDLYLRIPTRNYGGHGYHRSQQVATVPGLLRSAQRGRRELEGGGQSLDGFSPSSTTASSPTSQAPSPSLARYRCRFHLRARLT